MGTHVDIMHAVFLAIAIQVQPNVTRFKLQPQNQSLRPQTDVLTPTDRDYTLVLTKTDKTETHTHTLQSLILDYLTLILRCLPPAVAVTSPRGLLPVFRKSQPIHRFSQSPTQTRSHGELKSSTHKVKDLRVPRELGVTSQC